MRQRTTFFHENEDAVEPSELKVDGRSLAGPKIKAVREDRFTFGLEELPDEVQRLLQHTPELHLRWSSSVPYQAMVLSPWASRLPPGLHAFYTPQEADISTNALCNFLRNILPLKDCSGFLVSTANLQVRWSLNSLYTRITFLDCPTIGSRMLQLTKPISH